MALSIRAQNFINATQSMAQEFIASAAKLLLVCKADDPAAAEVRAAIVAAGKNALDDGRFLFVGKAGARVGDEVFVPAAYKPAAIPTFDLSQIANEPMKFLLRHSAARGECTVKE